MATTLNDIQEIISTEFDESGSTITSNSSEYTRRRRLINNAERFWREFYKWSCLRKTATLTTDGTSTVSLPTDYTLGNQDLEAQNSILLINNVAYTLVQPNEVSQYDASDSIVYITGNDVIGYELNIQPTLSAGVSFTFPYYSTYTATDSSNVSKEFMVNADDKTLIPDPTFLSDYVLARLFRNEPEMQSLTGLYSQEALQIKLNKMIFKDVMAKGATVKNRNDNGTFDPIGGYLE